MYPYGLPGKASVLKDRARTCPPEGICRRMAKIVMKRIVLPAAFAAITVLVPSAGVRAALYPAFTTDPAQLETEAKDQAWKEALDKACAPIRDPHDRSDADARECQRLADQEPRCLGYKDFAAIYLKMRDSGAVATDVAEGVAAMQKNTALYPPDFSNAVRHLFQIVFYTDRAKLGTPEEFSARAYRACMSGHLL